ncbi:MAG: COG3650 family protein [Gammaproteobacteria bacterium]
MKSLFLFILTLTCFVVQAENKAHETAAAIAKPDVWQAAKLRGVSFRAIGQEPAWLLEISDGEKILLVTAYGQERTVYPYVEPRVNQQQDKTVFSVKGQHLEIVIEGKDCSDIMSGEKFAASVFITLNGKQFKGCGRALH